MSSVFCILHWSSSWLIPFPMLVFVKMGTSFWLVFVLQRILFFQSCSRCMLSTEGWIWLSQIQLTPFLGKRTRGRLVLLQHTLYTQPTITTSDPRNSFLLLHCPSSDLGPLSDVIHVWVCTLTLCHSCAHASGSTPCSYVPPTCGLHRGALYVGRARGSERAHAYSYPSYCSRWKCRLGIVITSWASSQNLCPIKKRNRETDWFLLIIRTASEI